VLDGESCLRMVWCPPPSPTTCLFTHILYVWNGYEKVMYCSFSHLNVKQSRERDKQTKLQPRQIRSEVLPLLVLPLRQHLSFFFVPFFVVHLYTSPSLSPLFFSKSNQIQANSHLWEVSCFCRRVVFVGHGESKHTAKKKRKDIENNSSNVNSNLPAGQNTRTHTLSGTHRHRRHAGDYSRCCPFFASAIPLSRVCTSFDCAIAVASTGPPWFVLRNTCRCEPRGRL
jgi:hypothetical protein